MNKLMYVSSTFLFSMPSFFRGAARALDMGSTFDVYNESDSEEDADVLALSMDWLQVGDDIIDAMEKYEQAR
jgi:hypothetical protein